jgi:transcriptional regulator with XRE-family HTH domain
LDARNPSNVDQHVGRKMVSRREELNLTQPELADRLGVSYQQLQKYENGKNRISAGRLWLLARALDTTIMYFYEGLESFAKSGRRGLTEESAEFSGPGNRDESDLLAAFRSIKDPDQKKAALAALKKQVRAPASKKR